MLEIDGRRAFAYRTTYFDTAELRVFRDHVQQRRRRYKCRSREYVDSGLCTFEVKLKGRAAARSSTAWRTTRALATSSPSPRSRFLRECLERTYGRGPDGGLRPALAVAYTRMTFAAPALGERVTATSTSPSARPTAPAAGSPRERVIVESKSARGNAAADRALRELGARPARGCSKVLPRRLFTHPACTATACGRCCGATSAPLRVAAVALALGAAGGGRAADVPRLDDHGRPADPRRPEGPGRLTVGGAHLRRRDRAARPAPRSAFPKKPYAIETDAEVRLLGLPRERDWDLNASYTDPTLLRDVLAHAAARRLGLAAQPHPLRRARVNGRYRGVYVLMSARAQPPPVGRRAARATEPASSTAATRASRRPAGSPCATRADRRTRRRRGPRAGRCEAFEAALGRARLARHLDEASAVDYVLHAELLKNQDAFLSSTYLHQREDGKLALGPVWDFDLSAGNSIEPALSAPEGWLLAGRPWAGALLADPGFQAALAARWRAAARRGIRRGAAGTVDRDAPRAARARRGATSPAGRRSTARCSATSPCTARTRRRSPH